MLMAAPKHNRLQRPVTVAVMAAVAVAAMLGIGFFANAKAAAHPYDAPQMGDFRPGSFHCFGSDGTGVVEFQADYIGSESAAFEVGLRSRDGKQRLISLLGNPHASAVVGGAVLDRVSLSLAPGATAVRPMTRVVVRVNQVNADQVFVLRTWYLGRLKPQKAVLAVWTSADRDKCGGTV